MQLLYPTFECTFTPPSFLTSLLSGELSHIRSIFPIKAPSQQQMAKCKFKKGRQISIFWEGSAFIKECVYDYLHSVTKSLWMLTALVGPNPFTFYQFAVQDYYM